MNVNAKLLAALVVCVLLFAAGWFTRDWYDDSVKLHDELLVKKATDAQAKATVDAIAKIPALTTQVYHATQNKIYTDCQQTDEAWQVIQGAFK